MNGNLEAEVFMKQLEVARLEAFQLRRSMEAKGIDHKEVPVFEPQNWEEIIKKEDLENSSYSDRQIVGFLSFKLNFFPKQTVAFITMVIISLILMP
jgi:hypothetical protein